MAKKEFKGGMESLLSGSVTTAPGRGRPKTNNKVIEKTSELGTKPNETRATFIVNQEKLETLKALAWHERKQHKDLIDEALNLILKNYESKVQEALKGYKRSAAV